MGHKTDTSLTGSAGEHLVVSRLLQRGIVAALAPDGVRKIDVLVNPMNSGTPAFIQVKARQYGSDGGWHMSAKHEKQIDENLYFCFVDFEPPFPNVYVIPSSIVADVIARDYQTWLETPGKNGRPHRESSMRRLKPKMLSVQERWMENYLEKWDYFSN